MTAWLGFDVGGQSVKAALVDPEGRVIRDTARATGRDTTVPRIVGLIVELVEELGWSGSSAQPLGVGVAGCVTLDGVVRGSPNLPALTDVPMARVLSDALGMSVVVDNDAHCHALAESWTGVASGVADFLLVTLGSGIGSGLVIDSKVYRGTTGYGCEFGHMIFEKDGRLCACGNRGCIEAYVSEVALRTRIGAQALALGAAVGERVRSRGEGHAQALLGLADEGHLAAVALVDLLVAELGTALGSAVNLFDVQLIVVGGGIAPGLMARRDSLMCAAGRVLFAREPSEIRVESAAAGVLAGAVGAARMAMKTV